MVSNSSPVASTIRDFMKLESAGGVLLGIMACVGLAAVLRLVKLPENVSWS